MAVGSTQTEERRSFGDFKITGDEENKRITLSKKLEKYDFPTDLGDDVIVELVECDDRPNRLEIIPCDDGGE